jgi:AraC family transcriptional regulator
VGKSFARAERNGHFPSPLPSAVGAPAAGRGVTVELRRLDDFAGCRTRRNSTHVLLHIGPVDTVERISGEHAAVQRIRAGQISIIPREGAVPFEAAAPFQCLVISVEHSFISLASCGSVDAEECEFVWRCGVDDPFLRSVCQAMRQELETGEAMSSLYCESLATSLALHLIAKYRTPSESARSKSPEAIPHDAIRRAIAYINEHFTENLTLSQIAGAAGLSEFHFARLFKRSVGTSPHQFVLKRRIAHARELLLDGALSLAEVALETGFCDQSHLGQSFRKVTGYTPKQFMRQVHAARPVAD